MMLKKEMKMQGTGGKGGRGVFDEEPQEMNELIESDQEVNAGDVDDDRYNRGAGGHSSDEEGIEGGDDEYDYDTDELSLQASDEERD